MRQGPFIAATFALAACLATGGCRSTQEAGADGDFGAFGWLSKPLEWGAEEDEPREGVPERVVATWTDTIRQQPGKPAERGFGGRVYFYDRTAEPIVVSGRLVVYAFDENGRADTDHKPTRRYVFPAQTLARHMSQSEIGASYSVWLPWDGVEGPTTDVSLIARFEPLKGGGLVVSDQATERLPGRDAMAPPRAERQIADQPAPAAIRQATFDEAPPSKPAAPLAKPVAVADDTSRRRMSTTTINHHRAAEQHPPRDLEQRVADPSQGRGEQHLGTGEHQRGETAQHHQPSSLDAVRVGIGQVEADGQPMETDQQSGEGEPPGFSEHRSRRHGNLLKIECGVPSPLHPTPSLSPPLLGRPGARYRRPGKKMPEPSIGPGTGQSSGAVSGRGPRRARAASVFERPGRTGASRRALRRAGPARGWRSCRPTWTHRYRATRLASRHRLVETPG